MKKSFALIPHWNTSTHDLVFENIIKNLNLQELKLNLSRRRNLGDYITAIAVFVLKLPTLTILHLKNDVRPLKVLNVNLGHGLNESAIAESSMASFAFNVAGYKRIVNAFFLFVRMRSELKTGRVSLVLGGDEAYSYFSYASQLALQWKIPALFIKGGDEICVYEYDSRFLCAGPKYEDYPKILAAIGNSADLERVDRSLEDRVNGIRKSLRYMEPGIEKDPKENTTLLNEKGLDNAFWIYLHDFYDSPGVYGKNVFKDHVCWVTHTVYFLLEKGARVVIKRHPNERPQNGNIISHLKAKFADKAIWVDKDFSIREISKMNPKAVVSVYGTIIVEATYAGVPVISCGRSPYVGFDTSYRAENKSEYEEFLVRALSPQGLAPKPKIEAVKSEYAHRILAPSMKSFVAIPFDDIDDKFWQEVDLGNRPSKNFLRREIFLRDAKVRKRMSEILEGRDLSTELRVRDFLM